VVLWEERPVTDWKPLIESPPPIGCKFIVLYNDGSGAAMFWRHDDGYISSDGDEYTELSEGYDLWTELPQDKEFWCEICSEDPMTLALPQAQRDSNPSVKP
jgi:hypothetical protein